MTSQSTNMVVPIRPGVVITPNMAPRVRCPLTLISGGVEDASRVFRRAYHDAQIARAERELIEARWSAAHSLTEGGAADAFSEDRDAAFRRMQATVERVVALPAMSTAQLRQKKSVIGTIWLKAEGLRYEVYRLAVANDAARLGVKA